MSEPDPGESASVAGLRGAADDAEVRLAAAEQVGAATRALMEALLHACGPAAELLAVAEEVAALAGRLRAHAVEQPPALTADFIAGRVPRNPVIGSVNPLAPPLTCTTGPAGEVHGTVTLSTVYEGPPGAVHGGVTAMLLDQVLGHAVAAAGNPAMTAELTVRYRRPTPVGLPLELHAWPAGEDGRDMLGEGTISCDGVVTVRARGRFRRVPGLGSFPARAAGK